MKLIKLIPFTFITLAIVLGCANCGTKYSDAPNIRIQPGIERCWDMCNKFEELQCIGYYEDIEIDCSNSAYENMIQCENTDGGIALLDCTGFCEYEMSNSVQLNPVCLADNLQNCSEIETICLD